MKLIIKNLSLEINNKKILNNINLNLNNDTYILFGKSGSGKSSLLNTILGSVKGRISGDIIIERKNKTYNLLDLEIQKRGVGILFQDLVLFPNLSIKENIEVGKDIDNKLKESLIDKLGVRGLLNKYPHEISGGEAQRVAFIRTIITKPNILLLDEPFDGLDSINSNIMKDEIITILKDMNILTIIVTHNKEDIIRFGGNLILMEEGKIKKEVKIKNKKDLEKEILGL